MRSEGILTQLIFEHSLRIRTVFEAPEATTTSHSAAAGHHNNGGGRQNNGSPSRPGINAKAKRAEHSNLTGKINNLMSTASISNNFRPFLRFTWRPNRIWGILRKAATFCLSYSMRLYKSLFAQSFCIRF